MQWPKISVVTAVRNGVAHIAEAIESVVAQDYPNLEYIILDGASTDGTQAVIERYAAHIAFWESKPDADAAAACNEGYERATGDIIAFLNADDWYEPGALRAVGEAFAADPTLDMVTVEVRVLKTDENPPRLTKYFRGDDLQPEASAVINGRFFKRSMLAHIGIFRSRDDEGAYLFANDLEFMLRVVRFTPRHRILPVLGYSYRAHPGSFTFAGNPVMKERLYRERGWIAKKYLADRVKLPGRVLRKLQRWHTCCNARELTDLGWTDKKAVFQLAWRGFRINPLIWPFYMAKFALARRKSRIAANRTR